MHTTSGTASGRAAGLAHQWRRQHAVGISTMRISTLIQRWGLFAATVFLLLGVTLAYLEAGPVSDHDGVVRYAFWLTTSAATFLAWWLSQWVVVSGRDRLTRRLLVASCLLATLLFVPASLVIDLLFEMPDEDASWYALIIEEWLVSALPVFSGCMIASLPAWLSTSESVLPVRPPEHEQVASASDEATSTESVTDSPAETLAEASDAPPDQPDGGLLPIAVRGGVLRATADLQYVHLNSPEGITTVPGPMHRVIGLLGAHGLEVRRGEWIADRHVKQVKSVRGRWVVLLKDGQQVTVSRRRLAEVKERWGSTRFA
jgi:hypothetical protein